MNNTKLAFLSHHWFEGKNIIRGTILITDENTKPIEFRITSAIRPTSFQKALYGNVLEEHILIKLIAIPLLKSLKEQPDIILVQEKCFFDIESNTPIVRLFDSEIHASGHTHIKQELICPSGKFETIFIEMLRDFEPQLIDIQRQLSNIFVSKDLSEPFERSRLACEQASYNEKMVDE